MVGFFFDTYALIETAKGSTNYKRFAEEPIYTGLMNLYEFYYQVLKEFGESVANEELRKSNANVVEFNIEDITAASLFRLAHAKRKLSYVDTLGYVMAKQHQLRFLTGDRQFRDFENVEFLK